MRRDFFLRVKVRVRVKERGWMEGRGKRIVGLGVRTLTSDSQII